MKSPFKINLKDKVAVVTGAGGVLCSMIVRVLAENGAKVALLDLNLEVAQKYAEDMVRDGFVAKAYRVNVLEKESIEQAHQAILNDLGKCDILINGAGGNHPKATTTNEYHIPEEVTEDMKTFFDLEATGVEFVFNLNFMGTLLPTQIFAVDMIGNEQASIINIASMNAYTPLTKIPAYSGAKAVISNFTQWLAVYFSKVGIRVNALAPGFFVTKQNEKLLFDEEGNPTPRSNKILNATPMGRYGKEEELIGTLLYLVCHEASSFVTGVVISIDGGCSSYSGV